MDAVEQMQATLDVFQREMPEGAYLKLCNCAKELHHVTKLYEVTWDNRPMPLETGIMLFIIPLIMPLLFRLFQLSIVSI